MAYPRTPSGMVEEFDFSGGVNLVDSMTELPKGQMTHCLNLIIDPAGGLKLRNGAAEISTQLSGTGTVTIRGEGRFVSSAGTEYVVLAYHDTDDDAVHFKYSSGGAWSAIALETGVTINDDAEIKFCMAGDLLLIFNGTDRMFCWDGTNDIVYLGITAPPLAANITYSATGLTGTYWYIFAYKNSLYTFVSSAAPVVSSAPANQKVLVEIPIDAAIDPGVDKVRIYRSTTATSGQPPWSAFYYLTEVAYDGNPAVTYTDNTADATLINNATFLSESSGEAGIYDHDLCPDNPAWCASHKGRLFVIPTNSSIVYWSKINEPAYFQPGEDMEIDPGVGSYLNQIAESENGVFMFKDASANIIETYGDPVNWRVRKISTQGCIASRTVRAIQNHAGQMAVARLALDGLRLLTENDDILISTNIDPLLRNLPLSIMAGFTAAYLQRDRLYALMSPEYTLMGNADSTYGATPAVVTRRMKSIGATDYETGGNEGANLAGVRAFYFHLNKPVQNARGEFIGLACTFGSKGYKFVLDNITPSDDTIYGVSTYDKAKVLDIWTGHTDQGEEIPFSFTTRPISPNDKIRDCRFNEIYYRMRASDTQFDLNASLDFGVAGQILLNQTCLVSSTNLGVNCLVKSDPMTFVTLTGAGTFTVGNHYFLYRLVDTNDPQTWDMVTSASYISAAMNVPSATNGFNVLIPGDLVAYTKGYRYYAIFHATSADYTAFTLSGYCGLVAMNSNGTAKSTAINGLYSGVPVPDDIYAIPPAELKWSAVGMKILKVPLSARFRGNYLTVNTYGYSHDESLRFLGLGFQYKGRAVA